MNFDQNEAKEASQDGDTYEQAWFVRGAMWQFNKLKEKILMLEHDNRAAKSVIEYLKDHNGTKTET